MAQKVVTLYYDDLTGEQSVEVQAHTIALDGVLYEIDLGPDSYDKLYEALAPFLGVSRKPGRQKAVRRAQSAPAGGPTAEALRSWAREQGLEVNDRGRVPATIREAYDKAH